MMWFMRLILLVVSFYGLAMNLFLALTIGHLGFGDLIAERVAWVLAFSVIPGVIGLYYLIDKVTNE